MAEMSGYFTTAATAVGTDQQVSYTQTHDAIATRVIAACHGFEGVAPAYLNSLSATATAANTVSVDTGGAVVDGKWFINDAAQDVTITSAAAGKTRIDRIVLRCDWAAWNVSVYNVTGTDADLPASPTAPTITQTSGTTYDILLWQALVDEAGAVTLTDERTWARISVGEIDKYTTCAVLGRYTNSTGDLSMIQTTVNDTVLMRRSNEVQFATINADNIASDAVTTAKILDANVTQAKLATGASKVTNRQGGSETIWSTTGTTNYAPTTTRIQCGAIETDASGAVALTFPVSFSYAPIVFVTVNYVSDIYASVHTITAATCSIQINSTSVKTVYWLAIGPE